MSGLTFLFFTCSYTYRHACKPGKSECVTRGGPGKLCGVCLEAKHFPNELHWSGGWHSLDNPQDGAVSTRSTARRRNGMSSFNNILSSSKPDFLDHAGMRNMIDLHSKFWYYFSFASIFCWIIRFNLCDQTSLRSHLGWAQARFIFILSSFFLQALWVAGEGEL